MDTLEYFDEQYAEFSQLTESVNSLIVNSKDIIDRFSTVHVNLIKNIISGKFVIKDIDKDLQEIEGLIKTIRETILEAERLYNNECHS